MAKKGLVTTTSLSEDDGELTAKDLLSFALHTARGMQHLEANSIVHRDVAARIVLVGYNCVCKISDFGLARDVEGVDVYERTSKGPLPDRWMSPKALIEGFHSHKADVWAFGVLLPTSYTTGNNSKTALTSQPKRKRIPSDPEPVCIIRVPGLKYGPLQHLSKAKDPEEKMEKLKERSKSREGWQNLQ
ncbi:fibroblast growth factor receptor 2-like [Haliotis rufescens]|uniref:fibroblast growth factor receptor 2-like n=1 Tax=Haliotis rufescens TaxID=6454 RepID=UPI00201E91FF|nr:fibroblast growth factor receptor 2-like [Haliotis rufescens]